MYMRIDFFRPNENSATVHVFYASLNFKDVMIASGKLLQYSPDAPPTAPSAPLGYDFSGVINGKRIMGVCPYGSIGLQCKADKELIWEIPEEWTLEDAATVPVVYVTVRSCSRSEFT